MAEQDEPKITKVDCLGSSKKDLLSFPRPVVREIGVALLVAQYGGKAPSAKPLRHVGGGVLEIVENFDKDTYRAVYTVKFDDRIYVLHCFQKKSRKAIKTPKQDLDLIKARMKLAELDYTKRRDRT